MVMSPNLRAKRRWSAVSICWSRKKITRCASSAARISATVASSRSSRRSTPWISAPITPVNGHTSITATSAHHDQPAGNGTGLGGGKRLVDTVERQPLRDQRIDRQLACLVEGHDAGDVTPGHVAATDGAEQLAFVEQGSSVDRYL